MKLGMPDIGTGMELKLESTIIGSAAMLAPFIARIPGTAAHGVDWFWSYASGPLLLAFIAVFSLIPAAVLIGLLTMFGTGRLRFVMGMGAMTAANLILHAQLDLASDPQAAIALVIFPVLAAFCAAIGYFAGWIIAAVLGR